ncbi:MAG: helicase C-terminal domain-containing protein [Candidatus Marinimicrobia bacterium]|nr:helicase C-terminal domain-containing protein [Candidatus Neomarinimicrobiota bacterium]
MSLINSELLKDLHLETCIAFDVETTGLDPKNEEVIQFSAVKFINGEKDEELNIFCNPGKPIPPFIVELTRIDDAMVENEAPFIEKKDEILDFFSDYPLIAHNARFDVSFLEEKFREPLNNPIIDTLDLSRIFLYYLPDRKLETLSAHFDLETEGAHRADVDTRNTGRLFYKILEIMLYYDISLYKDIIFISDPLINIPNYELYRWVHDYYLKIGRTNKEKVRSYHPMPDNKLGDFKNRVVSDDTKIKKISRQDIDKVFGLKGILSESLPGYEMRLGQMKFAGDIVEAFNEEEFLVGEAGTGVGKSLAYLIPAVQWMKKNRRDGMSIVVSSYTKTLQEQLFFKDIPFVHEFIDKDFTVVMLKGRQNYICLTKWHTMIKNLDNHINLFDRIHLLPLLVWLRETKTGDIEENSGFQIKRVPHVWARLFSETGYCTTKKCAEYHGCYLGKIRKLAYHADVIIVNHSLLLSDAASDNAILPEHPICIIDEAHNIIRSAYQYLGMEVNPWRIERTLHKLYTPGRLRLGTLVNLSRYVGKDKEWNKEHADMIIKRLSQCEDDVAEMIKSSTKFFKAFLKYVNSEVRKPEQRYIQKVRYKTDSSPFEDLKECQDLMNASAKIDRSLALLLKEIKSLNAHEKASISEQADDLDIAVKVFGEMQSEMRTCFYPDAEDIIYWYELPVDQDSLYMIIKASPLHVNEQLYEKVFKNKKAVIATSATLTISERFKYFMKRSGMDLLEEDRTKTEMYESPFNYEEQCEIWNVTHLGQPGNQAFDEKVAGLVGELSAQHHLGTLVLTTSYASIRNMKNILEPISQLHKFNVISQMGSASRTALLQRFIQQTSSILIGTESFWEGVDIPGEPLEILVMSKLPFAVPTEPVVQAITEDIEKNGGNAFMEYSIPEAILKFKQGFGRLIRSKEDRGIALIMDNRLSYKRYGQYFQQSIPATMHFVKNSEELQQNIRKWVKKNKR